MQTFSFCVVFVFGKQAMRVFGEMRICFESTDIAMENKRVANNEIYLSDIFFCLSHYVTCS